MPIPEPLARSVLLELVEKCREFPALLKERSFGQRDFQCLTYGLLNDAVADARNTIREQLSGSPTSSACLGRLEDERSNTEHTESFPPVIGVAIELSVEYVVAVLATLSLQAIFVPLDPTWPPHRFEAVLRDFAARALLFCGAKPPAADLAATCKLISLAPVTLRAGWTAGATHGTRKEFDVRWSSLWRDTPPGAAPRLPRPHTPLVPPGEMYAEAGEILGSRRVAYIMYTSGSTGRPKGVCGTERGILMRCRWMEDAYPYKDAEICCLKTSPCFVDSLAELFSPLLAGVPSLLVPSRAMLDPGGFVQLLAHARVSRLVAVPFLLQAMLQVLRRSSEPTSALPELRLVISSGEALPWDTWHALKAALVPAARVINVYGCTEVAADCSFFDPDRA
ncbi:hypothetical protein CYMTET_33012, partial [Cymbomonas tetramitiformis]